MRLAVAALLVLTCSGCFYARRMAYLRESGGETLKCDEDQVTLTEREEDWQVSGCGKVATCITEDREWVCKETAGDDVKERLAVETGCAVENIAVVATSKTVTRLSACGKSYVCDISAPHACRRALEETAQTETAAQP